MADITNITLNGTNYTLKASGGSGGEQVVELTQAQYDALSAYAPDTTYIITDAQAINMDDYATTGTVNTLSGQVSTLSGSVANKADKANVTANSSRLFPRWNAQGIVTGTTGNTLYEASHNINGSSYTILRTSSSSSLPTTYAPTSAGTQNAVLLSNGSGAAPIWSQYKFVFIGQTDYDALTTKDSTTIYFIVGD